MDNIGYSTDGDVQMMSYKPHSDAISNPYHNNVHQPTTTTTGLGGGENGVFEEKGDKHKSGDFYEVVIDGDDGEKKVVITEEMVSVKELAMKPYADMGKDDLLRFSETDFWKRARLVSIIIFWLAWLALLGAVIGLTIVAPRCGTPPEPQWWQKTVIYQVYIRSFYDTDFDGIGDLKGIAEKLDYIKELGAGAVLISSFYVADNTAGADFGYQVVNHTDIDLVYGSFQEFEFLVNETHSRDMAIILDFIPNYTSRNHLWFTESEKNEDYTNKYWNYYVWAKSNPNNWLSVYGEPAWTLDPDAGGTRASKYFLHQFLNSQPELNLRSSAVQDELESILHFWLDKGVDGFRVVGSAYLVESQDLSYETDICNPPGTQNYDCLSHEHTRSQPESFDLIAKWRSVVDSYSSSSSSTRPRILLTDGDVEVAEGIKFYGQYSGEGGAQLPITYQLTKLNSTCDSKCVNALVYDWIDRMPQDGTADWTTGDQDRSRLSSYAGSEDFVNLFNMIKMTLPGAALIYYGDEVGMTNGNHAGFDPAGEINETFSRDGFRTPMQWTNDTLTAGFANDTQPWMAVPDGANANPFNVEAQNDLPDGFLNKLKSLTQLRIDEKALQFGQLHKVDRNELFAFVREHEGFNRIIVVGNFGNNTANSNIDVTTSSTFGIPSSAQVAFVTNSTMSQKVGESTDLKKVSLLPGHGFIATWEYTRP